ncbi:LysR family transcriptional regulator [Frateuria aurantia]
MNRFNSMEVLVAVIEAGSFSAAARRLDMGQPAVSKAVAQLEAHLHTRLFIRTTRGLAPTDAAQAYYQHALQALQSSELAEQAARDLGHGLVGRLRISAPVTFARLHIVPVLGAFLAQHPGLEVDVVLDDRPIDLLQEGIDVAIRIGPLADSSMTARPLLSGVRKVIATPAYFARHGMPGHPSELPGHACVIYGQGSGVARAIFQREGESLELMLHGRLRTNAAEGVRAAVLSDQGLAVVSAWMFAPELAEARVVTALDAWTLPGIDLSAIFPAGRLPGLKARRFIDFLGAVLQRNEVLARLTPEAPHQLTPTA